MKDELCRMNYEELNDKRLLPGTRFWILTESWKDGKFAK